jgi:hypothetical protein
MPLWMSVSHQQWNALPVTGKHRTTDNALWQSCSGRGRSPHCDIRHILYVVSTVHCSQVNQLFIKK